MSPTFTLPDASGLAPLVLPDSFLGGGESSSPQPSHDAVRRFEAAMGGIGAAAADGVRVADARVAFDIAQSLDAPIVHAQENDTAAELGAEQGAMVGQEGNRTIGQEDSRTIGQEDCRTEDKGQTTNTRQIPIPNPQSLSSNSQSPAFDSQFSVFDSQFPTPDPQILTPNPQSPIPHSPFPVPRSPIPVPNSQSSDDSDVVLQAAPVQVAASEVQGVAAVPGDGVQSVSAVSARTEAIVDTVNEIVEAVVGQMVVTPSLVQGEGEVRMTLKPTVLDGSDITLSAKDGTLTVAVAPATPAAEQAIAAAMPRLEIALAEHAPAFRHVEVALVAKKGKTDEVA